MAGKRMQMTRTTKIEPADALLVIDVGNTRIGLGVWDVDGIHDTQRVPSDQPDAWRGALEQTWQAMDGARRALVMGSVNPAHAEQVRSLAEKISGLNALRVRDDLPLPMPVDVENIREVGVDRVCCAAAAYERVQTTCAVASVGTALTIDCVSADGRFLGGAILPGMQMGCDALHAGTSQLPRIEPEMPRSVFGRNTHDAIVNGAAYGVVGALRELVERYATELREWPQLVLTGGNAAMVAELADFVDAVVPDLCLMGIALAYRQASGQP